MNRKRTDEYEQMLEAAIDRELKAMPEASAPASLANRVMAAIESRVTVPWYRQSWQMWPVVLRAGSLLFLLAFFGGLCFATRHIWQIPLFAEAMQKAGGVFAAISAIFRAATVLLSALVQAVKQMGTIYLAALLLAMGFAYAMCVGLGAACWRLAYARC
jgi:hypothetical protein